MFFPTSGFALNEIQIPRPWQRAEEETGQFLVYVYFLGEWVRGDQGLPRIADGWYLTPTKEGTHKISYRINGKGATTEPFPVRRSFTITVKKPPL